MYCQLYCLSKDGKTRAKGNDVITNVISANQHFAWTFSMQIFKFQRRSCKLFFLFPPCRQRAPESLLAGQTGRNVLSIGLIQPTGEQAIVSS